ncbi:MAG: serine hydrolase, partial [Candidatus Taylorbacteria bacterium]|nr:serine hydrolase [Candidatus Taylorbacteria bacterium]
MIFAGIVLSLAIVMRVSFTKIDTGKSTDNIEASSSSSNDMPIVGAEPSFLSDEDRGIVPLKEQNVVLSPPNDEKPSVTARAYLVGNVATGRVYFGENISRTLPVASMSKLVTAITAMDRIASSSIIEITIEEASTSPDASNLQPRERFTMNELLYPLLLDSSNVAAEAIASSSDRVAFKKAMAGYAWEIGMPSSYFADPSGIDPQNTASAMDVLGLAKYLFRFHSDILAITRICSFPVATTTDHGAHVFKSIHPFVDDPRFIGGKTGRTSAAKETM